MRENHSFDLKQNLNFFIAFLKEVVFNFRIVSVLDDILPKDTLFPSKNAVMVKELIETEEFLELLNP